LASHCEATLFRVAGRCWLVSRIVFAVVVLAVVVAGCGSAARPQAAPDRGIPADLARVWAGQAAAVAAAASAGDSCRALRLADALRAQVVATQRKVPLRLRSPLLAGVKALAGRITCTPPPAKKPPKPPKPPDKHHGKPDDHGHHHGHGPGGGDGNDQ
jgi:hypothetical protein